MTPPPLSFSTLLEGPLSKDRLSAYQQPTDRDALDPVARYLWNLALSEALYPTLQALEVALRNTLNDQFATLFGVNWYEQQRVVMEVWGEQQVSAAKNTLTRAHKPHTPGRIIAELNFGFWTHLFNVSYERHVWQTLWSRSAIFPGLPRRHRTRRFLSSRMERTRRLRNRVFHYEPIWHWRDLAQQHADVLEAIRWVSPVLRDTIQSLDRFPDVHQQGPSVFRAELDALCLRDGYAP
jgi:hypothetical protein